MQFATGGENVTLKMSGCAEEDLKKEWHDAKVRMFTACSVLCLVALAGLCAVPVERADSRLGEI
eukprot:679530-Amphidinium_carterae.1